MCHRRLLLLSVICYVCVLLLWTTCAPRYVRATRGAACHRLRHRGRGRGTRAAVAVAVSRLASRVSRLERV